MNRKEEVESLYYLRISLSQPVSFSAGSFSFFKLLSYRRPPGHLNQAHYFSWHHHVTLYYKAFQSPVH